MVSRFLCLEGTLWLEVNCVAEILHCHSAQTNAAISQGICKLKIISDRGMIHEEAVRWLVQDEPDPDKLLYLMEICRRHRTLDC